jgi:O-antigen ligase
MSFPSIPSIAACPSLRGRETPCVHYQPVIDRITIVPPLDPPWLILFAALFAACALATARRPAFGAAALLFVTPFAGAHAVVSTTITVPKIVLLGVIVGLSGKSGAWRTLIRPPFAAIALAFIAIIGADALTFIVASDRGTVFRESLKWCEYLAYFCTSAVAYAADPDARLTRGAFTAAVAVASLSALAELATSAGSGLWIGNIPFPRIAGVLEGPNQLGGYLELGFAGLGAWQLRAPRRSTGWVLLLAGAALALTFSRAAFAGVVAVAVIFALLERGAVRRLWPFALGLAAGYTAALGWIVAIEHLSAGGLVRRDADLDAAAGGGVGNRAELWRAALFFFRAHPLLGIGAGNFELDLPRAGVFGVRTHANSWYLQSLAEGGILLFGATILWIVTVVASLPRRLKVSPWALAAFAGSCALILHGFVDDLVFYPKVAEPWIALIAIGLV